MSRGKYSPTVIYSYGINQDWHRQSEEAVGSVDGYVDGYDSYGYDVDGYDRANIWEGHYINNEELYETIQDEWRCVYLLKVN